MQEYMHAYDTLHITSCQRSCRQLSPCHLAAFVQAVMEDTPGEAEAMTYSQSRLSAASRSDGETSTTTGEARGQRASTAVQRVQDLPRVGGTVARGQEGGGDVEAAAPAARRPRGPADGVEEVSSHFSSESRVFCHRMLSLSASSFRRIVLLCV